MSAAAATVLFQSLLRNEILKKEKKRKIRHVKKKQTMKQTNKNPMRCVSVPIIIFASPRRPQFWKSPWEQKFWKQTLRYSDCLCGFCWCYFWACVACFAGYKSWFRFFFSFFWFVETQCATLDGILDAAFFHGLPLCLWKVKCVGFSAFSPWGQKLQLPKNKTKLPLQMPFQKCLSLF